MIFATFNGLAFIHMFLTAPETKGKTLEEMDEVFNSGLPAWRSVRKGSRLDELQRDIEAGKVKIGGPLGGIGERDRGRGRGERGLGRGEGEGEGEKEKEGVGAAHREHGDVL